MAKLINLDRIHSDGVASLDVGVRNGEFTMARTGDLVEILDADGERAKFKGDIILQNGEAVEDVLQELGVPRSRKVNGKDFRKTTENPDGNVSLEWSNFEGKIPDEKIGGLSIAKGGTEAETNVEAFENLTTYSIGSPTQMTMSSSSYTWYRGCWGKDKFVFMQSSSQYFGYSYDGIDWTIRNMPANRNWHCVCYGNNRFVAVAYNSRYGAYSSDGITWTQMDMGVSRYWYYIRHENGIFIANTTGDDNYGYSSDGINWSSKQFSGGSFGSALGSGNGKFIRTSRSSSYLIGEYSDDGLNWTMFSLPSAQSWEPALYANGKYMTFAGGGNYCAYSTDCNTWVQTSIGTTNGLYAHATNGSCFLLIEYINSANIGYYSYDAINWTKIILPQSIQWSGACYGNKKFIIVANSTTGCYITCNSTNARSILNVASTSEIDSLVDSFDPSTATRSIASGGTGATTAEDAFNNLTPDKAVARQAIDTMSADELRELIRTKNWTADEIESMMTVEKQTDYRCDFSGYSIRGRAQCYAFNKYIILAYSGNTGLYSTNLVNWTQITIPSSYSWDSIATNNQIAVCVNYDNAYALYSYDGINWTQMTIPSSYAGNGSTGGWQSVCYGNGKFVAVCMNGYNIIYSENGINWTSKTIVSGRFIYGFKVFYGKDKYIIVGGSETYRYGYYSTDGITWIQMNLPTLSTSYWKDGAYGNGVYVICAHQTSNESESERSNRIAYSYNGISWTKTTHPVVEYTLGDMVFGSDKFLLLNYNINGVYNSMYSSDGINWTAITPGKNHSIFPVENPIYGNGKYVIISGNSTSFCVVIQDWGSKMFKDSLNAVSSSDYQSAVAEAKSAIA